MVEKTADLRIPLPPVKGWEYKDQSLNVVEINFAEEGGEDPIASSDLLLPPSVFSVYSMTPRITPDGKTLVDIVFEIQEVSFADSYEVRVS